MCRRVLILMMTLPSLFNSGCVALRCHQTSSWASCLAACHRLHVAPTHYVLTVNLHRETVSLFEQGVLVKTFPCSTSRFGAGERQDSDRTPLGLHRIVEKIGDGEPAGTIFRNRQPIGNVGQLGGKAGTITTRILWLEGLEPGYNHAGNVDSHERLIYIHGTGDQSSLGRPITYGCIHMADADLLWLFDLLPSGTLVWIAGR